MNSESEQNKPSVSVDIGIKASASLEIKAEVPPEHTGRLVAALTDIIRPFSEKRGLKADQIRLQREDVLLEIAKKALARAELEHIPLQPVPAKFLVPFLEKASLEDMDTPMQDRWATLLLSASAEYHAQHLSFIDILSRLSSHELSLLEQTAFAYQAFPETWYPGGHHEENAKRIAEISGESLVNLADQPTWGAAKKFVEQTELIYGRILHAEAVDRSGGSTFYYGEYGQPGTPQFSSVEILQRERLIDFIRHRPHGADVAYFELTYLGVRFVRICAPQSKEMALRHRKAVSKEADRG